MLSEGSIMLSEVPAMLAEVLPCSQRSLPYSQRVQESTKASALASASTKTGRFSKLGLGLGEIEQGLTEFQIHL